MLIHAARYTVGGYGVAVTAASGAGDLLQIVTPADALIVPIRAWVTTENEETSQQVGVSLSLFATAGSGGTSVTPAAHNSHIQASQTTCLRNNTTDATSTQTTLDRQGVNLLGSGYQWNGEGSGIIVPVSSNLVLKLETALVADSNLSFGIEFAELGQ